jgi:CMP-N-acetylneuraminic acid synthetase
VNDLGLERKVIALIPARGGSKSVPLKNLSKVGETSLLSRTIRTASEAGVFDEIWVSSDHTETLSLAKSQGALLHVRSIEAADDVSTAFDVIVNFNSIRNLREADTIVYLQPTSPFREAKHIREALKVFFDNDLQTVVSVKEVKEHPEKMLRLDSSGDLVQFISGANVAENRQNLGNFFYPNGAIYIFCMKTFISEGVFPTTNSKPYLMNELDSIDIDSEEDLTIAKMIEEFRS